MITILLFFQVYSRISYFFLPNLVDGMNPGASGRHILKIKRFLGTLLHFGCEISPDVGDRVRNLVFNLVVSFFVFFSLELGEIDTCKVLLDYIKLMAVINIFFTLESSFN